MKDTKSKASKWNVTDKKIKQIVIDLYKKTKYYNILYTSVKRFFETQTYQINNIICNRFKDEWDMFWYYSINDSWASILDDWWIMRTNSITDVFHLMPWFLICSHPFWTSENMQAVKSVDKLSFKAQDIQEKYDISNVTLKSRLKNYFHMEVKHQWKVWYLRLYLRFEVLYMVVLSQYIEENQDSILADCFNFHADFKKLW